MLVTQMVFNQKTYDHIVTLPHPRILCYAVNAWQLETLQLSTCKCRLQKIKFYNLSPWTVTWHWWRRKKYGAKSVCQLAILSICHFVNMPFCQHAILSTCHFVSMPFCQHAISSTCHFVNMPFCQHAILSRCHFVNIPFGQDAILSTCHLDKWKGPEYIRWYLRSLNIT